MADEEYQRNIGTRIWDLPKNEHGHIKLSDYHYNFLCSVASESASTNAFVAIKVEEERPEIELIEGYYLIGHDQWLITIGLAHVFSDCNSFIDAAISEMRFV